MTKKQQIEQAAALFRNILQRGDTTPRAKSIPPEGGKGGRQVSTPHPYYVVDGTAVLQGKFGGMERMTGYQSLVLEGETPVEVLIAATTGDDMSYAAGWSARAAKALTDALRVAEDHGIADDNFAVVTVPEVGFNALWYQERHELVPLDLSSKKSALSSSRVYSEQEVIDALQKPLRARFEIAGGTAYGAPRPPRA